jgi:transcription elongation factor GreA-like protein
VTNDDAIRQDALLDLAKIYHQLNESMTAQRFDSSIHRAEVLRQIDGLHDLSNRLQRQIDAKFDRVYQELDDLKDKIEKVDVRTAFVQPIDLASAVDRLKLAVEALEDGLGMQLEAGKDSPANLRNQMTGDG